MDHKRITTEYYSQWVGADINDFSSGLHFIYNAERNHSQKGYSSAFDIWILKTSNSILVSYGDSTSDEIKHILLHEDMNCIQIANAIRETFNGNIITGVKYVYTEQPIEVKKAIPLTLQHYSSYYDFNLAINPGDFDRSWLKEYYEEMVQSGACCGVFVDGRLVSCTDIPSMPYMTSDVAEIGINTIKEYRNHGYAEDACLAALKRIIQSNKCPVWSTSSDNIASQRLAEKIGFIPFGEYVALQLKK